MDGWQFVPLWRFKLWESCHPEGKLQVRMGEAQVAMRIAGSTNIFLSMAKRTPSMSRRCFAPLVLTLAMSAVASCFVGWRTATGRGAGTARWAEAKTETETKMVKSGPSEEAIKTRSIFMSLDSDPW
eukprot:Skav232691  [mRNA]  locus=scaffold2892:62286:69281:+ [translate_table: standard]